MHLRPFAGLCATLLSIALAACSGGTHSTAAAPDSAPASISFSAANYMAAAGVATLSVQRSASTAGAVSVKYATSDGSAVAAGGYTAATGTLQWEDGDASVKSISIKTNGSSFTSTENFTVRLSDATGDAELGAQAAATVTVAGSAAAPAAVLAFSASAYAPMSNVATLSVDRSGSSAGSVSVAYATSNGTASAGVQYTAVSGTLTWSDGDAVSKTIAVAVDPSSFTGSKTFTVILSAPGGGATLGTAAATVTMQGTQPAAVGTVSFGASTYSAGTTSATLNVERTAGSSGAVGVSYATSNGSAVSGSDYTATSGSLTWKDGDVSAKTITVTVNTSMVMGSKTFNVALTSPSGGAALGSPASASVAIAGSASAGSVEWSASAYTIAPSASSLTISVSRSGGSSGAAGVSYATANGTATAGTDYTSTQGTLSWASGDAASKTISVPILSGAGGNKNFKVALSNATGAMLGTPASATVSLSGMAVKVAGNHLVDGQGAALQLRGASVSGLESVAIQGWDSSDPWGGWKPVWSALQAWKINVIRLPMNEASWLDYTCVDSDNTSRDPDPGKNYRATVAQTIQEANAAGIYVILDLQWTAPSNYCPVGQNAMADADHSVAFWTSVAGTFKGNPAVIFELFNEPYVPNTDAGWDVWLNGGTQTSLSTPSMTFTWQAAGEQTLLNAVRATGATNVVLIGGTGYSNILTDWPTHTPEDPLNQLGAAWHVYSDNGFTDTTAGSSTVTMLAAVSKNVPLVMTEVGDADGAGTTGAFAAKIVTFADAQGYSYLGWTWNYWNQSANNLILDNSGTPTIGFGTYFKEHLVCRSTSGSCP